MRRPSFARLARSALLAIAVAAGWAGPAVAAPGDIITVAGNGDAASYGDGGLATAAGIFGPVSVARMPDGGYLIADRNGDRVRKVDRSGTIQTVAGNGTEGSPGDGGPAVDAAVPTPSDVVALPDGGFLVVEETMAGRIRKVDADGIITTIAGGGTLTPVFPPGTRATGVRLQLPHGVAPLPDGGFLITEYAWDRVLKVDADGFITTVAGLENDASGGFAGDGGPATEARLNGPTDIAVDSAGGYYIADYLNSRVRHVDADGTITTFAGNGTDSGIDVTDDAPATATPMAPIGVEVAHDGTVLISDVGFHRVRRVGADGIARVVAGGPSHEICRACPGFGGDGGPALSAILNDPSATATMPDGGFLIADRGNSRVRRVKGIATRPTAQQDRYDAAEGTTLTVASPGVLANDSDPDDEPLPLTAELVLGPEHGVLALNADGSFTYTPRAGYHGSDSFTYRASDGAFASGATAVELTVRPVYRFTGFAPPIDNAFTNAARAGQAIPVKYRLTSTVGTAVSDPASFVSITSQSGGGLCAGLPLDAIETYAGSSGLQYLGDGNWQFNWKTPKEYAGQCRTMTLTLEDGSTHTATFQFM